MKKILLAAALLAVSGSMALAGGGQGKGHGHSRSHGYSNNAFAVQGVTIVVSCWRGPWREVIWDRPNGVFFDSLVAAGYSQTTAHALTTRICRDQALVGNLQNRIEEVKAIIRSAPRG